MSSDIAIQIEGLGKRYKLGETHQLTRNFRETLMSVPRWVGRKALARMRGASGAGNSAIKEVHPTADPSHAIDPRMEGDWFWALKDINLEIKQGEAVGIIGRNGAGKSTLLKVLSRITQPTEGRALIHGRVGALLEVGTGMHPELTGRENIYLNGSIIGMTKAEINRKFDEIVDFAGIERFLDTPLKRYSSGMRVRLGFSVAAHLEPEILIVDEVLSVGDAEFRKKCLGKMDDVTQGGRTVLFVSHNLAAVQNLCSSAALLNNGKVRTIGPSQSVITKYFSAQGICRSQEMLAQKVQSLRNDPSIEIQDVFIGQDGDFSLELENSKEIEIRICCLIKKKEPGLRIYFDLVDETQTILVRSFHDEHQDSPRAMPPGSYCFSAYLPKDILAPHRYYLIIRATIHNERTCTGDDLTIGIDVLSTNGINRAYPDQPNVAKMQPKIYWNLDSKSLEV